MSEPDPVFEFIGGPFDGDYCNLPRDIKEYRCFFYPEGHDGITVGGDGKYKSHWSFSYQIPGYDTPRHNVAPLIPGVPTFRYMRRDSSEFKLYL
jgi:hypothetical protein